VDEAASLVDELVAGKTRVLGPDDPDTLMARALRASLLDWTGRSAEAVRDLEDLLADLNRVLGPDHPDTLAASERLAKLRESPTSEREADGRV
jgi:Tetratricopeptide repeat